MRRRYYDCVHGCGRRVLGYAPAACAHCLANPPAESLRDFRKRLTEEGK